MSTPEWPVWHHGFIEQVEGESTKRVWVSVGLNSTLCVGPEKGAEPLSGKVKAVAPGAEGLRFVVTLDDASKIELECSNPEDAGIWFQKFQDCTVPDPQSGDCAGLYASKGKIGEGVSSDVHEGVVRATGAKVAIKNIVKAKYMTTERTILTTRREIDIMRKIGEHGTHPSMLRGGRMYGTGAQHIVEYLGVFETPEAIQIVMEHISGGMLFDRVIELGKYSEVDAAKVMFLLISTLDWLHAQGVLHRDLKPENVMLNQGSNTDIKLIDFGMGNVMSAEECMRSKCGTPIYMAPEMFADMPAYSESVDIWAAGVQLFVVASGALPFYTEDESEYQDIILAAEENLEFFEEDWEGASTEIEDLLRKIITAKPKDRITAKGILEHPWITRHLGSPPRYVPDGVRAGNYDSDKPIDRRLLPAAVLQKAEQAKKAAAEPEPEPEPAAKKK